MPHNGKQKPADPEWALRTIDRGISDGFLNIEQAANLRAEFKPQAEAYANNTVHVRAHNREGKPVAAHTRQSPSAHGVRDDGSKKHPFILNATEQGAPESETGGTNDSPQVAEKSRAGHMRDNIRTGNILETVLGGIITYNEHKDIINEDMEDMEEEEREIYSRYPRNSRNAIEKSISLGEEYKEFKRTTDGSVPLSEEDYIRLRKIRRMRNAHR